MTAIILLCFVLLPQEVAGMGYKDNKETVLIPLLDATAGKYCFVDTAVFRHKNRLFRTQNRVFRTK